MSGQPVVAVIGCGYVGLTTAAILANCGLKVYALEINPDRLATIKAGRSFFFEAGIGPLIKAGLASGNLVPTDGYEEAVPTAGVIFSCVGTPDNDDGSANLSYVYEAARQAAGLMRDGAVFVQKSTVPVGTGCKLHKLMSAALPGDRSFSYVSNPEFLREGTAIGDSLWFDRIVTGSDDSAAAEKVAALYRLVEEKRDGIAGLCDLTPPATAPLSEYVSTSLSSAELIKVSANAFLALKVSFANSIAKLADRTGADVTEVMDAVGADKRIGRAFLNAGRGYGGGCFPKDVSSLIRSAADHGVDMDIMQAAAEVNGSMPHYIIHRAEEAFGQPFNGVRIAILGVAFKAGTSDTRKSPGIAIANTLEAQGAVVSAYDPQAMDEADALNDGVGRCDSLETAVRDAEIIFITTDWPEFVQAGIKGLAGHSGASLIVDAMNCLDSSTLPDGLRYLGVGR